MRNYLSIKFEEHVNIFIMRLFIRCFAIYALSSENITLQGRLTKKIPYLRTKYLVIDDNIISWTFVENQRTTCKYVNVFETYLKF